MLNVTTLEVGDELFIPGAGFLTVLAVEGEEILLAVSTRNAHVSGASDHPECSSEAQG